ncbi:MULTISPECIES: RNA-binding S4 domain-containing protein [unclassified Plantibacter]|jgi:ribosome-associated heat shock protein Hsp15|uniref:RNA-binding S4 domain-containing protein n=1 Tax=unclassified Plantibacter TaxID=2624265 RepID=UPI003D34699B
METTPSVRVDAWLWAVRLTKTRSAAATACRAGHVRVNGDRAKPAQAVRVGDEVRLRVAGFDRIVEVKAVIAKRVGAEVAATCLVDHSPPPPSKEQLSAVPQRDRGAGRPTKRERRDLEKLRARGPENGLDDEFED